MLYHWKRQHLQGRLHNEPTEEAALRDRIEKLERLVGKLTLENEPLKRACRTASASLKETANHPGMGMPWCPHPMGV